MEYIARWFPFTLEEMRAAFMAEGMSFAEAETVATNLAKELALAGESEGFGFAEYDGGAWLDAIAATSEDAARRVDGFRQRWGPPQSGIWEVIVHDDER